MAERITSLDQIEDAEKFLKAHYEARDELAELRTELKQAQTELETLKESNSDEEVSKWRERAIKAAVKAAVEAEGIKNADRITKYINLDGVDFDDEEKLTGFDEKLNEVKKDFPELFDAKKRAGRESADIHTTKGTSKPVTGTEAQVARIFAKQ